MHRLVPSDRPTNDLHTVYDTLHYVGRTKQRMTVYWPSTNKPAYKRASHALSVLSQQSDNTHARIHTHSPAACAGQSGLNEHHVTASDVTASGADALLGRGATANAAAAAADRHAQPSLVSCSSTSGNSNIIIGCRLAVDSATVAETVCRRLHPTDDGYRRSIASNGLGTLYACCKADLIESRLYETLNKA